MSGEARELPAEREHAGATAGGETGEVEAELRLHLDLLVEQLRAEGYGLREAQAEARRRFGDPERLALECSSVRAGASRLRHCRSPFRQGRSALR